MLLQQQISTQKEILLGDIYPNKSSEKTLSQNWLKEIRNRGGTATGIENEIRVTESVHNEPQMSQSFIG